MNNNIIPFEFKTNTVRVIKDGHGEPWFVLADVCKVLDIANPRNVTARLDDDEKNTVHLADGIRGNPNVTIINEPGLYSVVLRSDKPDAKPFKRWVTHDVLPSIRKTGSYHAAPQQAPLNTVDQRNRDALSTAETMLKLGALFGTEKAMAAAVAAEQVKADTGLNLSKLLAAISVEDAPITPTELGKELGISGRKMNAELEAQGLQSRDDNGDWSPTDKGRRYCTVNPYKSPNSDHTGYRILWHRNVLDAITSAV